MLVVELVGDRVQAVQSAKTVAVNHRVLDVDFDVIVLDHVRQRYPRHDEGHPHRHDEHRVRFRLRPARLEYPSAVTLVRQMVGGRQPYTVPYLAGVFQHIVQLDGGDHVRLQVHAILRHLVDVIPAVMYVQNELERRHLYYEQLDGGHVLKNVDPEHFWAARA